MRMISLFSKKSVKLYKKQNDVLNKNNVQLDIPLHENNNAEELQQNSTIDNSVTSTESNYNTDH